MIKLPSLTVLAASLAFLLVTDVWAGPCPEVKSDCAMTCRRGEMIIDTARGACAITSCAAELGTVKVKGPDILSINNCVIKGDVRGGAVRLLRNTTVLGEVKIEGTEGGQKFGWEGATMGGVNVLGNRGALIGVKGKVKRSVSIGGNPGPMYLQNNTIGGDLACKDNENVFGFGNVVEGRRTGQCGNDPQAMKGRQATASHQVSSDGKPRDRKFDMEAYHDQQ